MSQVHIGIPFHVQLFYSHGNLSKFRAAGALTRGTS